MRATLALNRLNCDLKNAFMHVVSLHPYMVQVLRVHLLPLMPFDRCPLYAFRNLAYSRNLCVTTPFD